MPTIVQDVFCDLDGTRIFVRAPYDGGRGPELAKRTPGAHWSKSRKVWTYPLDIETCRCLRLVYGDRLEVGNALAQWARLYLARERDLPVLAAASDAPLQHLPSIAPRLAAALRPYQRVGAAFVGAASRPGEGSLLADEPRTGKTLQAIAGILDRGRTAAAGLHLVVCPKVSVDNVWGRELKRWTDDQPVWLAMGNHEQRANVIAAARSDNAPIKWLVVNHDMLAWRQRCVRCAALKSNNDFCALSVTGHHEFTEEMDYPDLFGEAYASIIVDESHKVFGSLRVNKGTQVGEGLKQIALREHGIRLAVTGTPFGRGGRVMGMFGTLHWLRPAQFTSFWRWADRYLVITENRYGYKEIGGLKDDISEADFFRMLGTVILRRTRREVMPWLAAKVYEDVYVDMTPKQARQYKKMEKESAVGNVAATGVLAELTRLKQFSNAYHTVRTPTPAPTADSGKLPALLERLDEHDGEKAIVFTQFEQFVPIIRACLEHHDITTTVITGSVSDKERTIRQAAFQAPDGPRVIIMTTQTGGVSITLDRAESVHMIDELWNPEDNVQAEDRAVNTTQDKENTKQLAIYYYRSNDTVEGYIRKVIEDKATQQHHVLDGRRGLEYIRALKGENAQ